MNALLQILLSALLGAWSGNAVHAQDGLRDPMRPPTAALPPPPPANPADAAASGATSLLPRHLMGVDGRRYVMVGTRKLGVGDLLGTARIERIEDAAVIVREGGTLQRLPLYASATSQPASSPTSKPAPGAARPASPPRRGASS
jgi:hypothetical protein